VITVELEKVVVAVKFAATEPHVVFEVAAAFELAHVAVSSVVAIMLTVVIDLLAFEEQEVSVGVY